MGMAKLARWNPWREMLDMRDEFDRMLDIFRPDFHLWEGYTKVPAVDIYEDEDNVFVKAELPGLNKEDISLTIEGDTLVLSGRKSQTKEEKKENYYRKEIREGAFSRTIDIPCPVDKEKVSATYKDGILEVVLPKTPEVKRKTIKVDVK
jgi:HSP20 family protein